VLCHNEDAIIIAMDSVRTARVDRRTSTVFGGKCTLGSDAQKGIVAST
jgi:hypothetical protein